MSVAATATLLAVAAVAVASDECVDVGYDCGMGYEYNSGISHACCHGRRSHECCDLIDGVQFWSFVWLVVFVVLIVVLAIFCCCPNACDNDGCCGRRPGDPPPRKPLAV